MGRLLSGGLLLFLLPLSSFLQAAPQRFTISDRQVSGIIPDGWAEIRGQNVETVLKIAKQGAGDNIARISIMVYAVPAGGVPAGFDVWNMSDAEIQASGEGGSVEGETVKVLKFGRGQIDRLHMVWTLTQRTLKEGTTMWQLAYEGLRGSDGITVQLTVAGDQEWFNANEASFTDFLKVLKLSVPKAGS